VPSGFNTIKQLSRSIDLQSVGGDGKRVGKFWVSSDRRWQHSATGHV
jgi:hypothetical protein